MAFFHGKLLEVRGNESFNASDWATLSSNITKTEELIEVGEVSASKRNEDSQLVWKECEDITKLSGLGWKRVTLSFDVPLHFVVESELKPFYEYILVLRLNPKNKMLVLCHSHDLTHKIMQKLQWTHRTFTTVIDIGSLVQNLSERRDIYRMGGIIATVDGHGKSLVKIQLWGSDIASAEMYQKILNELNAFKVKLLNPKSGSYTLEISSEGQLSIPGLSPQQLKGVDQALAYISNSGLMQWWSDAR